MEPHYIQSTHEGDWCRYVDDSSWHINPRYHFIARIDLQCPVTIEAQRIQAQGGGAVFGRVDGD